MSYIDSFLLENVKTDTISELRMKFHVRKYEGEVQSDMVTINCFNCNKPVNVIDPPIPLDNIWHIVEVDNNKLYVDGKFIKNVKLTLYCSNKCEVAHDL
jgi:hypothetical protein